MTTAMGLVIAFSQDFHDRFPKVSYKAFLRMNCFLSFIIANLGLDKIVTWSTPILMLLYPLAIVLIILGMLSPLFANAAIVYRLDLLFTFVPAVLDMVNAFPPVLRQLNISQTLIKYASHIPLYQLGLGWLPFAIVGVACGLLVWRLRRDRPVE